ncbi:hypothetical protein [uncultured Ferrimonas sp.]|uniref:hypothetical protein n=1 Tax=uncultured Ferrimonas sp. TaxID=432640 RepID=UPI0026336CA3|nr:hypothetical protein [uncultured Ferrimonas sp.]
MQLIHPRARLTTVNTVAIGVVALSLLTMAHAQAGTVGISAEPRASLGLHYRSDQHHRYGTAPWRHRTVPSYARGPYASWSPTAWPDSARHPSHRWAPWQSLWRNPYSYRQWPPRYRYQPTPRLPKPIQLSQRTIKAEHVERGTLNRLPANARTLLTANERLYRWQDQCYRLNHQDSRYHPQPCPRVHSSR